MSACDPDNLTDKTACERCGAALTLQERAPESRCVRCNKYCCARCHPNRRVYCRVCMGQP